MNKNKFLVIGVVILGFWLTGFKTIDPDFGWHYKMGELIVRSGIPDTDPFSYSMPSYPFVDYEWLTNVIWYLSFEWLGMPGWAAIYGLMAVVSMWISIPTSYKKYAWIPMLLGWTSMLFRFGVRPQIVNWLFWALIVRGMFEEDLWIKYRKYFPVLMLVWGNLHGSYPLGIVAIAMWLGLKGLQNRKYELTDVWYWILGLLATVFANPYGWRNWAEVILVMQQSSFLRNSIAEWQPFYNVVDFGLIAGLVFTVTDGFVFFKRWKWWQMGIGLWMIYWGITGLRYAPLFMIFAAPIVAGFWVHMGELTSDDKIKKDRLRYFSKVLLWISGIIFGLSGLVTTVKGVRFSERETYPVGAVEYLKQNGFQKNIFSEYGWGGYLIWKMPENKYFIDGRMSCFSWIAPEGESDHALMDYQKMLNNKDELEKSLDKYDVNTLIWPKSKQDVSEALKDVLDTRLREILGLSKDNLKFDNEKFLQWFFEMGWEKVYEDETAVVYTNN